ncbi:UDP-forming cellulose synthase catalytic subunit [Shewanella violacea]|uniref:Cellulose synthase catalytic subunit [UDP-forming] n=1 Tax=Shewanella violacea (strain JCM 10179 / CIP 106290 / LMG 19151 / DSS12) TaxID=637905 RepID=D4ZDH8_SHEVD|nr:UDP-forming cellulose synthase catalytic subunit [Shewanella violacea]BAJ00100.1 cellulose synthase catalytic subunit [Shewanella violacea DSS12]
MFSCLNLIFKTWIVSQFAAQKTFIEEAEGAPASWLGELVLAIWFTTAFLFLKPTIAGVPSWKLLFIGYPQINFARPVLFDLIRFVIQTSWLLLFQQQTKHVLSTRIHQVFNITVKRIKSAFYLPLNTLSLGVQWLEAWATKPSRLKSSTQAMPSKPQVKRPHNLLNYTLFFLVAVLAFLCFTVPFNFNAQIIFVCLLWALAMMFRRMPGRFPTVLLIILSVTASCRYIWWRYTSTLNWDDPLALFLGGILLMAETYAWIVLLLGYFQNIWPLNRKPVALPVDQTTWPEIDIMIPSYNEGLDVVRATVYASLGVDWPKDKLNIYILDDGKRDDFRDFAKEAGVNYIRRPTNEHAKAGNINYALAQTKSEFVAIFDCDHIPTRAFFQLAMGFFLKDPKMSLVQTPHHFFSPDPFERNLASFRDIPNEGNLFYGLIQDGNDMWDATFFCGSCAILRRAPLEEVGGIAVETVTEDAHTSLRLHRLGYHSAYLKQPLSAGLATETLSAHIGQRIRWARGMAQIFRLDNPLTGSGLKWQQRLCYVNAMLHFLSGIPRIIFLIAPLTFLLLHSYVISAPAFAIILYALPHMVHASVTNSRIQGKYRYSFWGEVYETVLAWYIAKPTTVALFAPHKGNFNVTAKGGLIDKSYFDWVFSLPYLTLVIMNIIGLGFGVYRIGWGPDDEIGTVIVNILWTIYNLLILGGAVAVAAEEKQVRKDHRVAVALPMSVRLHSGHLLRAVMQDFSLGGIRVKLEGYDEQNHLFLPNQELEIILHRSDQQFVFPTIVTYAQDGILGLQLAPLSNQQQVDYVQCTFARADTWTKWQQSYEADKPLASLSRVLRVGASGYQQLLRHSPTPVKACVRPILFFCEFTWSLRPRHISTRVSNHANF